MRSAFRWTCWCLLAVFPAAVFATDNQNIAMVTGNGTVRINGAAAPPSSTVFVGDKVATADDSSVTLTSKGRNIILPDNSSVTYNGKRVRLEYGRAIFSAKPGTEAQLGNLTITPAQAGSQFEMWSSTNQMVLIATAGPLNLTDGVHQMTLESGQTLMSESPDDQSGGGSGGGDSGKRAPAPALTTGIPGWVLIMTGTAMAFGLVLGLAESGVIFSGPGHALSPSRP